ncbi:hypothetical protein EJ377_16235 [Chryseobacterium arthrosphaerae]|uniref:Uncharacterized protein n=1 Tax=Chryseobacterium arthrosphaerae TaxID=651561 RepID=A0A3S0QFB1_9FLAO|nr:hypothetical protein EJ377_16235 [Chryseobacterium arthrosphaerae]
MKTYVSVHGVDEIVAGHTFNWYNTSWKVGNMRGGSANSTGYRFEFSNDGGASYEEKVKIHTDGNITTQITVRPSNGTRHINGEIMRTAVMSKNGKMPGNRLFEWLISRSSLHVP